MRWDDGVDAQASRQAALGSPPALDGLARAYLDRLLGCDRRGAERLILEAVDAGVRVRDVYLGVFQPVQYEVGRLWEMNRISVAVEHFCTASTQHVMAGLVTRISDAPRNGLRMIGCCVGGELHELGMRLVTDFFEMDGFDTRYLGARANAAEVVQALVQWRADVLGVSVTLPGNIHHARRLVHEVRSHPVCARRVVLVGGLAFLLNPELRHIVQADATARGPEEAVETAKAILGVR